MKYVILFYNVTKVGLYFYKGIFMEALSFTQSINGEQMEYATRRGARRIATLLKNKFITNENIKVEVLTVDEAKKLDAGDVFEKGFQK